MLDPIGYFEEFQMNANGWWAWKWRDGDGVSRILIRIVTSNAEMYLELQKQINVYPSLNNMELGFLYNKHSTYKS